MSNVQRIFLFAVCAATSGAQTVGGPPSPQVTSDRWTQIGHGVLASGKAHNASGRAIQAAWRRDALQGDQHILWIGTQWAGLWKSHLDGSGNIDRWIPLTDNFPGPQSMGSFLVNRANSNKILIGPGAFKAADGDGLIYRTRDQGTTWNPHSLPRHKPGRITRIVDDRADPDGNHVLAATSQGIFRSDDFGISWNPVYEDGGVTDLVQDTGNPTIWYAATAGPGVPGVILRSVNDGITWSPFSPGLLKISGSVGRVSLAACDSDPNVLYALVVKEIFTDADVEGALNGVYRSLDRGQNWVKIFSDNNAINPDNQGQHTCALGCDPANPGHIFFGLALPLETFFATLPPGAIPWISLDKNGNSTLDAGHADYNHVLFRPGHSSIVVSNDGGYYIYHPDPTGLSNGTVDDSGNLLGIAATALEVANGGLAASRANPNIFIAGIADIGVIIGDTAKNTLTHSISGDGGQGSIMPDNANIMAASTNGDTGRFETLDGGQTWFNINRGLEAQKFSSVLIDPTPGLVNPQIFTPTLDVLGLGSVVSRSVLDPLDWRPVSPALLPGEVREVDHTTNPAIHEIIATVKSQRSLFALTGPRSSLGNLVLADITPPIPALSNGKRDARANADKSTLMPDTIFYTTGSSRPSRAFLSTSGGREHTWVNVTGDLPAGNEGPDFLKLIVNPRNVSQMFLATSEGVYRTDSAGFHWYLYSEGLRLNEDVQDIVINVHGLDRPILYIGTRRGFWQRIVE